MSSSEACSGVLDHPGASSSAIIRPVWGAVLRLRFLPVPEEGVEAVR